jgi:hypothetical protein
MTQDPVTLSELKAELRNMDDAEFAELQGTADSPGKVDLVFIRTLVDTERLNEVVVEPLTRCGPDSIQACITNAKISDVSSMEQAKNKLMHGSVLVHSIPENQWWAVTLENTIGRAIESSETETILLGPKDSFSEQLEQNVTLIRRRLPVTELKTEKFVLGTQSQTSVVLLYLEGITNPEFIEIARAKLSEIHYDMFLDTSQVAAFMEDHVDSLFPQYLQTDRPDACAFSLGVGKLAILVGNSPFALLAPINFFHLFQSPEDYINRWPIASFLRILRYVSFLLSLTLIPLYVAVITHHYQMVPVQLLFVVLESRSKLPFTPFWEALLMLLTLEIIKEASLRMPTKSGQSLGVIGGIVIGQATVEAGFASQVLIVLVAISAIASFLVPNYLLTKTNMPIQLVFLVLSSLFGIVGLTLGFIGLLVHLNGLTSLKQPYLAPITPFYGRDWMDLFIRGSWKRTKLRPAFLKPLNKWRYKPRR